MPNIAVGSSPVTAFSLVESNFGDCPSLARETHHYKLWGEGRNRKIIKPKMSAFPKLLHYRERLEKTVKKYA